MFNFNNKKSKRMVSSVIILLLVLAMIIPTLAYLMFRTDGLISLPDYDGTAGACRRRGYHSGRCLCR